MRSPKSCQQIIENSFVIFYRKVNNVKNNAAISVLCVFVLFVCSWNRSTHTQVPLFTLAHTFPLLTWKNLMIWKPFICFSNTFLLLFHIIICTCFFFSFIDSIIWSHFVILSFRWLFWNMCGNVDLSLHSWFPFRAKRSLKYFWFLFLEDVLKSDAGECIICFEDMVTGKLFKMATWDFKWPPEDWPWVVSSVLYTSVRSQRV